MLEIGRGLETKKVVCDCQQDDLDDSDDEDVVDAKKALSNYQKDKINQGFLLCNWIPCLYPKFLNFTQLDLVKNCFLSFEDFQKI